MIVSQLLVIGSSSVVSCTLLLLLCALFFVPTAYCLSRPQPTRRHAGASRFIFKLSPSGIESGARSCQLVEMRYQRTAFITEIVRLNSGSKNTDARDNRKRKPEAKRSGM